MSGGNKPSSSKPSKKGDIRSHFIRKSSEVEQQEQQLREVNPKDVLSILQENALGGRVILQENALGWRTRPRSISWDDVRYIIKPEVMLHFKQNKKFVESNPKILDLIIKNNPPLDVVKAYVRAFPTLLITKTRSPFGVNTFTTTTSLSTACDVSSPSLEIVRYLIKEMVWCRKLSQHKNMFRNLEGGLGFFYNTGFPFGTSLDVVKVLLDEYPKAASCKNGIGEAHAIPRSIPPVMYALSDDPCRLPDYLEKLKLLLMAAATGTTDKEKLEKKFLLPHVFLEAITWEGNFARSSPQEGWNYLLYPNREIGIIRTLEYMKVFCPGEFLEADDDGNLPLHIVLSNKKAIYATVNRLKTDYSADLIEFLLEMHPESITIRNGKGQLPIHLALKHCIPCYQRIIDASPDWVFESKCPITLLYPFQMVYAANWSWFQRFDDDDDDDDRKEVIERHCTQVSFEILRRAPALAAIGLAARKVEWFHSETYKILQKTKLEKKYLELKISGLECKLVGLKENEERSEAQKEDRTVGMKRKRDAAGPDTEVEDGEDKDEESISEADVGGSSSGGDGLVG